MYAENPLPFTPEYPPAGFGGIGTNGSIWGLPRAGEISAKSRAQLRRSRRRTRSALCNCAWPWA